VVSNWLTIAGLFFLAAAVTCVVFVITDFLYGLTAACPATALVAIAFALLWYVLPLRQELKDRRSRRAG
jgi:peptidoglycan/LPS O-acetylase OafA/YrhL